MTKCKHCGRHEQDHPYNYQHQDCPGYEPAETVEPALFSLTADEFMACREMREQSTIDDFENGFRAACYWYRDRLAPKPDLDDAATDVIMNGKLQAAKEFAESQILNRSNCEQYSARVAHALMTEYAAHVLAQKTPQIRAEAVRDLINATPELAEILVLQAAKQVAKEMEAGSR